MRVVTHVLTAVLAIAAPVGAETKASEAERLAKAAEVLRESRPTIPTDVWNRARCVAVVPDLKKAAFIFGGEYGKGAMSCRAGESWSAPVFLQLAKGSWGFQAGAEEVDVLLLVMNESGAQKLMRNNVSLGADASIAAGPVGRQGQVGTDATLTAEILSYSRAKGLFAGINLSGGALRPDEDANEDAYGRGASPSTILASRSISAPTEATAFIQALGPATASSVAAATKPAGQATALAPISPSATGVATVDSDIRTQLVAMQQAIDQILSDQNVPVGTSGQATDRGSRISVSREQLQQLRSRIDAILASMNAR
jgi:SH3 domain-containing YSC84-like protein 1